MASTTTLLGAAGEYYVMSQLLRRGFIAALAPVGVPNSDIIVTDELGDRLCAIQVKSRREKGSDGGWHMSAKHEKLTAATLFYVFVDFGPELHTLPTCYVLPSNVVADTLLEAHKAWLAQPGRNGRPHKKTDFRRFLPDYGRMNIQISRNTGWLGPYQEAWHTLKSATEKAI